MIAPKNSASEKENEDLKEFISYENSLAKESRLNLIRAYQKQKSKKDKKSSKHSKNNSAKSMKSAK